MKRTKDFDSKNIKSDSRIIIYGAGRYGELAYWGLINLGLKADYFMDINRADEEIYGIPIISPSCISDFTEDAILVASYNYYNEILEFLIENKVRNIYNISSLLNLEYDDSVLSEYLKDEKANSDKYVNVAENECGNELVINHCEFVVTEKCTLKCKDCANLIQYYNHPKDAQDCDIKAFERFIDSIDKLLDLRILGGEPFCYSHLGELIEQFSANPKIIRTTIYTNSTLIPSPNVLKAIKENNVVVHMSNYGSVSSKLSQLDEILSKNDIKHYVHDYSVWKDLGKVQRRDYSIEQLENIYNNCVMATCYTFHKGKFWICPRASHGELLGYYNGSKEEYVDYSTDIDILDKREELKKLLLRRKPIEACYHCNGSCKDTKDINAAVQKNGLLRNEIKK